ncbi:hypothetical protein [Pseudomonas sp. A014]|uniref:hypothetical protein n=1 Tax=Pseudomonas sp. A014 TaxID=3458058 RepID=UPI0040374606
MAREIELYADSAQARETDRLHVDHLFADMDSDAAREANAQWLQMLREKEERHRKQLPRMIAGAIDQIANRWGYMGPRRPQ